MEDLELKLGSLEHCLRQMKRAADIIIYLLSTDDRGQTRYNALLRAKDIVKELDDQTLSKLYSKLFEEVRTAKIVYQQISLDEYFTFLERLYSLIDEVVMQANEADIALRGSIGLQSVVGIWGGRSWYPSRKSAMIPFAR